MCCIPTAQCCVFHYKQKERNQYKSIKSVVIITRIIISLHGFMLRIELHKAYSSKTCIRNEKMIVTANKRTNTLYIVT